MMASYSVGLHMPLAPASARINFLDIRMGYLLSSKIIKALIALPGQLPLSIWWANSPEWGLILFHLTI